MKQPICEVFESLEDVAGITQLYRHIKVQGVQYKAVSNTHNSIALFFEDGKVWFRFDLMVHNNANLIAFEGTDLPREIKVYIDFSFTVASVTDKA